MSSIHVARQGFVTKSALPSVSRVRGTTQVADNRTVLLLNGNGTNGAQNNTFLDSSTNNFSITRNGNATQGSFSPFTLPNGQWSNFFDGTGDYLAVTDNGSFDFGTGDFTVEAWIYPTSFSNEPSIVGGVGATNGSWSFAIRSATQLSFGRNWSSWDATTSGITLNLNQWYHVVASRSSGTLRIFVDGTQYFSGSNTISYDIPNSIVAVGARQLTSSTESYGNFFSGYMSNVRVVKGSGVYTSAFTPSTTPLTAITNTSLLTCQSNRFRDNSSNNFAITRNGDVRVTPWSPFAPTSAYSPSVNGGSGYFDGTGDFLQINSTTAIDVSSGDFTVEGWVYPTRKTNSVDAVFGYGNFSMMLYHNGTNWTLEVGNGTSNFFSISTACTLNAWSHIAVTRNGNTFTLWINGVSAGTNTTSNNIGTSSRDLRIGDNGSGSSQNFTGHIGNFRLVKGTAVYTANFTPPTAPVTNITNTSLLLNFTNAGIFDTAGDNVIETVGNAQIATAVKRYGSGSLSFDGSGDSIVSPNNPMFAVGTGDFTIEFWGRWNSVSGSSPGNLFTCVNSGTLGIWVSDTSVQLARAGQGGDLVATVTQTTGVWNHYAITRQSGTARIFKDGVLLASGTVTTNYGQNGIAIGGSLGSSTNGYVDDFRFTVGQARYTANFTPPTSELIIVGAAENIVNNSTYGVYQLA